MQVEISEERRSRKRRNEDEGDEEEVKMDDTEKNGMEDVEVSAVTSEVKQMEEDIDEIATGSYTYLRAHDPPQHRVCRPLPRK